MRPLSKTLYLILDNIIYLQIALIILLISSCSGQEKSNKTETHKYTNALINETSPYLLQHAHNPVDWHPWNKETLEKARKQNKLLLISIGYSACHWCHVMEHESFEDSMVAKHMNENFINIKIDREERPDIDQIYMTAVQLMNQRGGWPLNCIALPDGRPIWGGTYFQKENWLQQIQKVAEFYNTNPTEIENYATNLAEGIKLSESITLNTNTEKFQWEDLEEIYNILGKNFDNINGGPNRAPKFPIPNNYLFLMQYAHLSNNQILKNHVELTLKKMAFGGIYDQIGGGFSRYSVDDKWKVPHFEKMLYDNAQLVSLYSHASLAYKNTLYRDIVFETLEFVTQELTSIEGAFYSALDADSDGEEGKYYVWKKEELERILNKDFDLFSDYYNINNKGYWESGNYILIKDQSDDKFAQKHNLNLVILKDKIKKWKKLLLNERNKRTKPGLDDKSLTSWNALMCKAYIDAYMAFQDKKHLESALKNALFLIENQLQQDGSLMHSYKNGQSTINGFLEDYAFTIEAFIRLYEATFEEIWLEKANTLTQYAIKNFLDIESKMFFFTSILDDPLITRKMEINDNVIPASCSVMANNLFLLGHYLYNTEYEKMANVMLNNIKNQITNYPSGYSNWCILLLNKIAPFYEIAIVGENAHKQALKFNTNYIPNKLLIGSKNNSKLELLKNKYVEGRTMYYVCLNKSCQLPTDNIKEALSLIK